MLCLRYPSIVLCLKTCGLVLKCCLLVSWACCLWAQETTCQGFWGGELDTQVEILLDCWAGWIGRLLFISIAGE